MTTAKQHKELVDMLLNAPCRKVITMTTSKPREFYCDVIRINYEDTSNPYVDLRCHNNIDQLKSDNLHYFVNLYDYTELQAQADKLAEAIRDYFKSMNVLGDGDKMPLAKALKEYRGEK